MKNIVFLIMLLSSFFSVKAQEIQSIQLLNTTEFKGVISKKDVQLVDVRTPEEYAAGHIKDAVNIDYFDPEAFTEAFSKMDKNKAVYVYCKSGNRSHKASVKLSDMGFTQVFDLEGGYMAWSLQKE